MQYVVDGAAAAAPYGMNFLAWLRLGVVVLEVTCVAVSKRSERPPSAWVCHRLSLVTGAIAAPFENELACVAVQRAWVERACCTFVQDI